MKMNIGICTSGVTDEKNIRRIKEIGYDFVEAGFSDLSVLPKSRIDEFADLLRELKMPCVSMNGLIVGDFVITGENADHLKIADHIESTMYKLKELGCKNFVLGSGKARSVPEGFSREKAMEQIQSLIADTIMPVMRKYNAVLAIEELRKEECNVFKNCRETVEFIKQLGFCDVKLLVDYYHAILGGDTHSEISTYKGLISHVHIASPKNNRLIPQKGDGEDYKGFFDALDKAQYIEANISLEGAKTEDYYGCITSSLEYLRSIS